jgi:hypothetical protein
MTAKICTVDVEMYWTVECGDGLEWTVDGGQQVERGREQGTETVVSDSGQWTVDVDMDTDTLITLIKCKE